jgi:hypothetical protein
MTALTTDPRTTPRDPAARDGARATERGHRGECSCRGVKEASLSRRRLPVGDWWQPGAGRRPAQGRQASR